MDDSPGPSMPANEGVLIGCIWIVYCEGSEGVLEGILIVLVSHLVPACLLARVCC